MIVRKRKHGSQIQAYALGGDQLRCSRCSHPYFTCIRGGLAHCANKSCRAWTRPTAFLVDVDPTRVNGKTEIVRCLEEWEAAHGPVWRKEKR